MLLLPVMSCSDSTRMDITMTTKCMDFCQHLIGQGVKFKFELSFGHNQSFLMDTKVKDLHSPMVRPSELGKKESPSSLRRSKARREAYILKKLQLMENH